MFVKKEVKMIGRW